MGLHCPLVCTQQEQRARVCSREGAFSWCWMQALSPRVGSSPVQGAPPLPSTPGMRFGAPQLPPCPGTGVSPPALPPQHLRAQLGVLDQPLLLLAPLQLPGGERCRQLQDLQLRVSLQAACAGLGHPHVKGSAGHPKTPNAVPCPCSAPARGARSSSKATGKGSWLVAPLPASNIARGHLPPLSRGTNSTAHHIPGGTAMGGGRWDVP